jgi:hypothetical protein
MYIPGVQLKSKLLNTLEPDWPQHDNPATYVIVQQHSSSTIALLHFHSTTEKLRVCFKNVIISFHFFLLF